MVELALKPKETRPKGLDEGLFRRKMGARLYQNAKDALEKLDMALQTDNYATTEAVWFDLAADIMRKVRQDGVARQCEQLRDEATARIEKHGRMRKERKR